MKKFLTVGFLIFSLMMVKAQDSLITKVAQAYKEIIYYKDQNFKGKALDSLINKISQHNYTLIGEDHHINEVLHFTDYLTEKINFDNYVSEGNQHATDLMQKYIVESQGEHKKFWKEHSDHFAFYSFDQDRKLLEKLVREGKNIIELDQVFFNGDAPILKELSKMTQNKQARKIYKELYELSQKRWLNYKQNPVTAPPFEEEQIPLMYSKTLSEQLGKVLKLNVSEEEINIIQDMMKSNEIYFLGLNGEGLLAHETRITLMKNNLLNHFDELQRKRNLFKFGANHVTKHKSLWQNSPDVGNLVLNLADAEGQKSLHIAIIQNSGFTGSFFEEKAETSGLSILKPFNDLVINNEEWLLFDLNKINRELNKQKIQITSTFLKNFIEGYDYLILIPEVSAQKKLSSTIQ